MDVRRLAILRELADRGTVAEVADVLSVTPSAVSQQLKVLEREAGIALVQPAGRGVALTAAGRELARLGADLAVAIERTEARWAEYTRTPAGPVSVAVFPSGGEMLLPGLVRRVAGSAITIVASDEMPALPDFAELVPDHDVVIADSPTSAATWKDRGLAVVHLMTEPLDVAMPEGHPLAARASLSPRDLVDEDWIGVPAGFPFDRVLVQLEAVTGTQLRIRHRLQDNGIVEAMVAGGHGLGILPRFTTRQHGSALVTRPVTGVRASRQVAALLRPDRLERPSVRLVVEALRDEARDVAARHGAD